MAKYKISFMWLSDGFEDAMTLDTLKDLLYNLEEIEEHRDRQIIRVEKINKIGEYIPLKKFQKFIKK